MPNVWLLVGAIALVAMLYLLFRARGDSNTGRPQPGTVRPVSTIRSEPQTLIGSERNKIEEAAYIDKQDGTIGGDFYEEVAELLQQVLTENPARQDLRFKLLEVYFDSGRVDRFEEEMAVYQKQMGRQVDASWSKIQEMHASINMQLDKRPEMSVASEDDAAEAKIRRFGDTPEAKPPLLELASQYQALRRERNFYAELDIELNRTADRPRRLFFAETISGQIGGARIYIKREDTSTRHPRLRVHLMGQAWIARQLGREKLLYSAMTGDEALIAALAAAREERACEIFISRKNHRLRDEHFSQIDVLGAQITEVSDSHDAYDLREHMLEQWLANPAQSFMMLNLAAGPHPYPTIAADLQSVIGRETLRQINSEIGKAPSAVLARGGNNADAIGFVEPFLSHKQTELLLVSPDPDTSQSQTDDGDGLTHVYKRFITDEQKATADYILEDIEFPRVARELSMLKVTRRVKEVTTTRHEAKLWAQQLARTEGLIIPLETAHAFAYTCLRAKDLTPADAVVLILVEHLDKEFVTRSAADL